jgi:hypothetical protein
MNQKNRNVPVFFVEYAVEGTMKRSLLTVLVLAAGLPAALGAAEVRFVAPTWESPRYEIRLPLVVVRAPLTVAGVLLDGARAEAFRVFRGGKPADIAKPLDAGAYEIVLDHAWAPSKRYAFKVLVHGPDPAKVEERALAAHSPAAGGIPPGSAEGFHRVFKVEETAGLERADEVVELVVTAAKADLPAPDLRLFDGAWELPFEVLDFRASEPAVSAAKTNPPTVTVKLACPLSVGPKGRKLLLVLKGRPQAAPPGGIALAGEGLGKTLTTPHLVIGFQPKSGQVLTVEAPAAAIKLWNKAGVIHWNPDVFVPGVAWDHSFDWNPPAVFEEKAGAFLYLNARRGPMPRVKDVALEVRYRVDAFHPWFVAETMMTVVNDIGAIAVRNDEMVLHKELFDTYMYRSSGGEVVTGPLAELPERPFGLAHIAPPDIPWLGLVNTREKFGFFSIRLAAAASNLGLGGDRPLKAGTYFYAPSDGDYVYWVRPLIYTWGEYATNSLVSLVPAGSFFYEKNAYAVLRLDEGTPRELDRLARMLREPLRVF